MQPILYVVFAAVAVLLAVIGFFAGSVYRRKSAENAIGSAEDEAKRILSDAMKTAESRKKEALVEAKDEIHQMRQEAEKDKLPAAHRPDSMEICFIPDNDYAAWLERRGDTPPPGSFVDAEGRVLGQHKGIHHYTLGQRRGLGIPSTGRLFVTEIRPETNEVVLSHGEGLHARVVWGDELNWLGDTPLDAPRPVTARLRHSRREEIALLVPLGDGRVELRLDKPARAPTPGQLAAFYEGDTVLGSAWITGCGGIE